jgi:hypothetical protein
MADRNDVATLIDRIVRESKIVDAGERAELRRELESHFADVGSTEDALRAAIEHFGDPEVIGVELGDAHQRNGPLTRLLRLGTVLAASSCLAILLQLTTTLRVREGGAAFAVGAGFIRSLAFSAMLILVLVAAWELDIEVFCARLERHPVRMASVLVGLATLMVVFHALESSTMPPPGLALSASAVDVVIWTCTVAILARTDRLFARVFTSRPSPPRA